MTDSRKIAYLVEKGHVKVNREQLHYWLKEWVDRIIKDDEADTIVIVVETKDGDIYRVSQSLENLDKPRLLGLLDILRHKIMIGAGLYGDR